MWHYSDPNDDDDPNDDPNEVACTSNPVLQPHSARALMKSGRSMSSRKIASRGSYGSWHGKSPRPNWKWSAT